MFLFLDSMTSCHSLQHARAGLPLGISPLWPSDYWWPQRRLFYALLFGSCRTISAESSAVTRTGVCLTAYQVKPNRSLCFAIYEPRSDYWWRPSEFMLLRSHQIFHDSFWKEQYFQVWRSIQPCIAVLNMWTKNREERRRYDRDQGSDYWWRVTLKYSISG